VFCGGSACHKKRQNGKYLIGVDLALNEGAEYRFGWIIMEHQEFAGASKVNTSFLKPLENRLDAIVLPRIPAWLNTSQLTMLTVAWCAGILGFSYLAVRDLRWLWAVSAMIFCQYLTDHFDGKVGKSRGTGLERWGYYMDHLLDYFFMASVLVGYAFILPETSRFQLLIMVVLFGAYDMSTFLAFSASNQLKISYLKFGPTEFRLGLIVINGLVAAYGTKHMIGGLRFVNAGAFVGLCLMVYKIQQQIRRIDMEQKCARGQEATLRLDATHVVGNVTVQPRATLYEMGSQ